MIVELCSIIFLYNKKIQKYNLWSYAMVKLIILRGNSGSGKTTIAKELQRKFGENTMLISQDVIRREML